MGRYEADHILFGAAYYDEYLMMKGIDHIDEDMAMMKAAGLNVIRIAESTWSTCEPQPGVFDFTYVDRALDAAQRAGIDVIVGTPTYAVPSWLVKLDPESARGHAERTGQVLARARSWTSSTPPTVSTANA